MKFKFFLFFATLSHGLAVTTENLTVNGDAESGDLSGWISSSGMEVIEDPDRSIRGGLGIDGAASLLANYSFCGLTGDAVATATQDIDLTAHATAIDTADQAFELAALFRSSEASTRRDIASLTAEFLNASGEVVGSTISFDAPPRIAPYPWARYQTTDLIPPGTRSVRLTIVSQRTEGSSTESYIDGVSFKLVEVAELLHPSEGWRTISKTSYRSDFNAMAKGGERVVAVGNDGLIMVRTGEGNDTSDWRFLPPATTSDLHDIAWNGAYFLAVGENGTVLRSKDGLNWVSKKLTTYTFNSVAWGAGRWVVVSEDYGMIYSSEDGLNFRSRSNLGDPLRDVIWDGQHFIAVGGKAGFSTSSQTGIILRSQDGRAWTAISSPILTLRGIYQHNGQYLASSDTGFISSNDGVTWNAGQDGFAWNGIGIRLTGDIIWDGTRYIALAEDSFFLYSTNGTTWGLSGYDSSNSWTSVIADSGRLLLCGEVATLESSGDLLSGKTVVTSNFGGLRSLAVKGSDMAVVGESGLASRYVEGSGFNNRGVKKYVTYESVAASDQIFVAAGRQSSSTSSNPWLGLAYSTNGLNWTSVQTPDTMDKVRYLNGQFFALSYWGTFMKSTNGISWSSSDLNDRLTDIAWNGSTYALLSGNEIYTSSNGSSWTNRGLILGSTVWCDAIATVGNTFWVLGPDGLIFTSTDGLNWTQRQDSAKADLDSLAYGNGTYVLSGEVTQYSEDGVSWKVVAPGANEVIWTGSEFVAVAGKNVMRSSDGASWQFDGGLFPKNQNDAIWFDDRYYVVSDNGMIRSTDGRSAWKIEPTDTFMSLYAITEANGDLFAVGGSGVVLKRTGSGEWVTQATLLSGNFSLRDIAYGGGKLIAVGDSGRVFESADGSVWSEQYVYGENFRAVTHSPQGWFAVGTSGYLYQSADGSTWTRGERASSFSLHDIIWDGSRLVAVGNNGSVVFSSDGVSWQSSQYGTTNLKSVLWNGSEYVIAGENAVIAKASELVPWQTAWTPVAGDQLGNWNQVVWNGSEYLALGDNGSQLYSILANTAPATITLSANSIKENNLLQELVGHLSAVDPDLFDRVTFSGASGPGSSDNGSFGLGGASSEKLAINVVADFETQNQYSVRIAARDLNGNESEQVFTIDIIDDREEDSDQDGLTQAEEEDIYGTSDSKKDSDDDGVDDNDEILAGTDPAVDEANVVPIDIVLSNSLIEENEPVGTLVGNLSAIFADVSEVGVFSIVDVAGYDSSAFYLTGSNNRELRLSKSLDYEVQAAYVVRIAVRDQLGNSFSKDITIHLSDNREEDFDNDGYTEEQEEDIYGTSDLLVDTDGDGYYDSEEIVAGTDPTLDTSFPEEVITELDSDWVKVRPLDNSTLQSVAYSGTMFVAVGSSSRIETSTDGLTWQRQDAGVEGIFLYDVEWMGSQFVAVGSGGTILTSSNGERWVKQDSGNAFASFNNIEWNGTVFVAIANNVVSTSSDGVNWTASSGVAGPKAMVWSDGLFRVISRSNDGSGWKNYLFTSVDGTNWLEVSDALPTANDMIYDGTQYLLVGGDRTIHSSTDGITWTIVTAGETYDPSYYSIEQTPTGFIVSSSYYIETSTDGANWTVDSDFIGTPFYDFASSATTTVGVGNSGFKMVKVDDAAWLPVDQVAITSFYDIAEFGDKLYACGRFGTIMRRDSTGSWNQVPSGVPESLWSLASSASAAVAVGDKGLILRSEDGSSWLQAASPTTANLRSVFWDGTRFLASGRGGEVYSSSDGSAWSSLGLIDPSITNRDCNEIIQVGGDYYTVYGRQIYKSADATTWSSVYSGSGLLYTIEHAGSRFSAGGSGILVTSTDGSSWSFASVDDTTLAAQETVKEIAWVGGEFVAVSVDYSGFSSVFRSDDGQSWTKAFRFRESFEAIYDDNGKVLVAGRDLYSSPDLEFWQSELKGLTLPYYIDGLVSNGVVTTYDPPYLYRTDDGVRWRVANTVFTGNTFRPRAKAIIWNGSEYISIDKSIFRSPDGIIWTQSDRLNVSIPYYSYYSLAWNGSLHVAVGEQGAIAISTTSLEDTWTVTSLDPNLYFNEVQWLGTKFFATGSLSGQTKIYSSVDGSSWSEVAAPITNIVFDGTQYVGIGDGVHTSEDGVNWQRENADQVTASNLAWSGSYLLSIGSSGAFISTDGQSWNAVDGTPSGLDRVIWADGYFLASGNSGVYKLPTDVSANSAPTDISAPAQVSENLDSGTQLGLLSATDADSEEVFTYQLVSGAGDDDNASFALSGLRNNILQAAEMFDYETRNSYSIRIKVADRGGKSFEKPVTISIIDDLSEDTDGDGLTQAQEDFTYGTSDLLADTDGDGVNDGDEVTAGTEPLDPLSSPYFRPSDLMISSTSVDENKEAGEIVGTLSTVDPDNDDTFVYSFADGVGDDDNSLFTLTGDGGQILGTAVLFDQEVKPQASVRIRVTDSFGLFIEEVFVVTVIDDQTEDVDGDGLSELEEERQGSSDLDPDTDDDGYTDYEEAIAGSDPNDDTVGPNDNRDIVEKIRLSIDDGQEWDQFGASVALDGNLAVVGAPREGPDDLFASYGSVHAFDILSGKRLFKLTEPTRASFSDFGSAVAINGDYILVGANFSNLQGDRSGAAYLYSRSNGQFIRRLIPSNGSTNDRFGTSVALNGDYALVGAPNDDILSQAVDHGVVYVFDLETGDQVHQLTASDAQNYAGFGTSIATHGNEAVVGAPGAGGSGSLNDSGAAYVFNLSSGDERLRLIASDQNMGNGFGHSVGISERFISIGSRKFNHPSIGLMDRSQAYVFDRLTGAERFARTSLGETLRSDRASAVASVGTLTLVSRPLFDGGPDDGGLLLLYDSVTGATISRISVSGSFSPDQFGYKLSFDGNHGLVSRVSGGQREVYVYRVINTAPKTFADALLNAGLSRALGSSEGDRNNDGLNDELSYALGIPLEGANDLVKQSNLPRANVAGDRVNLLLGLPELPPEDVTYCIEYSPSLNSWAEVARKTGSGSWGGDANVVEGEPVGGVVPVSVENPMTTDEATQGFMRLRVITLSPR